MIDQLDDIATQHRYRPHLGQELHSQLCTGKRASPTVFETSYKRISIVLQRNQTKGSRAAPDKTKEHA